MKLIVQVAAAVSILSDGVSGVKLHFLHRNSTNGSKGKDQDNFQDELIDQADPEFKKYSQGDECISWSDMVHVVQQQCQGCSQAEKKQAVKSELDTIRAAFDEADKNGDQCIDKKEYKKADEFEGTAPEDPAKAKEQNKVDFELMDRNSDDQISESEAMHFCTENMPHADIDYSEFKKMFKAADVDKNGFISREEFDKAGQKYEGDGPEVPPPPAPKNGSNSTNGTKAEKKAFFFFARPKFGAFVKLNIEKMKIKTGEEKA